MDLRSGRLMKILANVSWMVFDKVFVLLLNFFVTVKIANYYGSLGYGTYQYALSIIAVFETLTFFVDSRVIKKNFLQIKPEEVVWNSTIARIVLSIIAFVIGVIYLAIVNEGREYNAVFLILLVDSIIINFRFAMQIRYEYLLQSKKVIIASDVSLTIGAILRLLAVHYQKPLIFLAYITLFSSSITLIIVCIQYRIDFGSITKGRINRSFIVSLFKESFPLAIAASCSLIYQKCDTIMIGSMLSKEEVGVYSIAVRLIAIVQIAVGPIRDSVYPRLVELYHLNKEQYAKRFIQITSILTWVYIIGVMFSLFILPYIFRYLRSDYADAFPVYKIYVLGSFFMYNAALRAGHYALIKRGNILMYSQGISVVVNIILNYFLIRKMGLFGAALATVITQCVSLLLSNILFGKEGREVFIWQLKGFNPINIFKK